jgi:hypothetical protein
MQPGIGVQNGLKVGASPYIGASRLRAAFRRWSSTITLGT